MIFPSIIVQTVDSSSVSIGPLTVSVYQGDITQQKSDAIVNSTNRNFDLSQGTFRELLEVLLSLHKYTVVILL